MLIGWAVAWSASILAARAAVPMSDVSVLVRVTYNTLEAICRDEFTFTESRATRP